MNEKYTEKVKVEKIYRNPEARDFEGYAVLSLKSKKVRCFVTNWKNPFIEGEATKSGLYLTTFSSKKTTKKEREITEVDIKSDLVNQYILKGEIIELSKHPIYDDSFEAIIDCGFYAAVRIHKKNFSNPKVGDFIEAEGRLDAIKIKDECNQ